MFPHFIVPTRDLLANLTSELSGQLLTTFCYQEEPSDSKSKTETPAEKKKRLAAEKKAKEQDQDNDDAGGDDDEEIPAKETKAQRALRLAKKGSEHLGNAADIGRVIGVDSRVTDGLDVADGIANDGEVNEEEVYIMP